jgi:hypothetical protein
VTNGQITLNGITEAQLILILQQKDRLKQFGFNVQQCQQVLITVTPGQVGVPGYNNAILSWQNEDGLKEVHEVVAKLLHPHAPHTQS